MATFEWKGITPSMTTWDEIRAMPTVYVSVGDQKVHESVFRSYQILQAIKMMLLRGDSPETVSEFIAWAEKGADHAG